MKYTLYFSLLFAFLLILGCVSQKENTDKSNKTESKSNQNQTINTHYQTFGEGKPILIINGGPGMNSEGFAMIAQKIANLGYQTIIYDQRGTGKSILENPDTTNITMDLMLEDIENLRIKLGIDKWTVFGHSFGGLLATHYAAKYPNQIEKIIFSSSGGINMNFTNYVQNRINSNLTQIQLDSLDFYRQKISNGDTTKETAKKRAKFLANAYVYNKSYSPAIAERLIQVKFTINGLVFQDLRKIQFDYTNQFKDFEPPVLVIQGKNDIISIETAQEISNSFKNSKLVLLENCGHYGWLDSEEKYMSEIDNFLKK